MSIAVPEEYGGSGGTFFQTILAIEELSAVDPSAGVIVDVQNTLVTNAILRWGNEEQKKLTLRGLQPIPWELTPFRRQARAATLSRWPHGQKVTMIDFILNGRKLWITNAKEAGLFLLFANGTPEAGYRGITAFLIESDASGFQVGRKEDKLGIRASSTCELLLEDCKFSRQNVLGDPGKGYKIAIETLE